MTISGPFLMRRFSGKKLSLSTGCIFLSLYGRKLLSVSERDEEGVVVKYLIGERGEREREKREREERERERERGERERERFTVRKQQ